LRAEGRRRGNRDHVHRLRREPIDRFVHLWRITVAHGGSREPFEGRATPRACLISGHHRAIRDRAAASEAKGRRFEFCVARHLPDNFERREWTIRPRPRGISWSIAPSLCWRTSATERAMRRYFATCSEDRCPVRAVTQASNLPAASASVTKRRAEVVDHDVTAVLGVAEQLRGLDARELQVFAERLRQVVAFDLEQHRRRHTAINPPTQRAQRVGLNGWCSCEQPAVAARLRATRLGALP